MAERFTLLVDNGSLVPAATLRLRELAAALGARVNARVEPVSLLHSSGIPAEQLDGCAAEILEPALTRRIAQGARDFLIVPLFFGPSRALTEYVPARVAHLRGRHGAVAVRVAPTLFDARDVRLAEILADHVRAVAANTEGEGAGDSEGGGHDADADGSGEAASREFGAPRGQLAGELRVALVDHGSPARGVTAVRDALARQLAELLGPRARVAGCSMERRPEPEYDFNEPLLEALLARDGWNRGRVIVAMQFLLAGRHAGPDGDVAQICRRASDEHPGLSTQLTPLVGEHPKLIEILADRWEAGWRSAPLP